MADFTPRLGLIKEHYLDYANILTMHHNWDEIDKLFHHLEGHTHDGVDSPLIHESNHDDIWAAIEELRQLIDALDVRLTYQEEFTEQFYEEFIRHNHDGVETIWNELFVNFNQMDRDLSTAHITPSLGLMHLPANYVNNQKYWWVGKPFNLRKDPYPDNLARITDPQKIATRAYGRIIAAQRGNFTPYLSVGNGLQGDPSINRIYPGAKPGVLLSRSSTAHKHTTRYTFDGKENMERRIPHLAYHHVDNRQPTLNRYSPKWWDNKPFTPQDYAKISMNDGRNVVVEQRNRGRGPVFTDTNITTSGPHNRVLYQSERPLAYDRTHNAFYWFNAKSGNFQRIPNAELGPIYDDRLVEVAAGVDEEDFSTWVVTTKVRPVNNPAGYFDVIHKIIKWNLDGTFQEGTEWKSAQLKRHHWPRPHVIAPTQLEVTNNKIYLIVESSFKEKAMTGKSMVNYYEDHGRYQWMPFQSIYGGYYRRDAKVDFANFNPGILGTVLEVNKTGDWVGTGNARVIRGAYNLANNPWAKMNPSQLNSFNGANDKTYMGRVGDKLVFYQAFCPYDGGTVAANKLYNNENWRRNNGMGNEWHGIIVYDLDAGTVERNKGGFPMKVNAGAGMDSRWGYIAGGHELVKQFVTPDGRIISTPRDTEPNTKTVSAFWIDRKHNLAKTSDRVTPKSQGIDPLEIDVFSNRHNRLNTATRGNVHPNVKMAQLVAFSGGYSTVGGVTVGGRSGIRIRPSDRNVRRVGMWTAGLTHNAKARSLFRFFVGQGHSTNILRVFFKAQAEGKPPYNPGEHGIPHHTRPDADYSLFVWLRGGGWRLVARGPRLEQGPVNIPTAEITMSPFVMFMAESRRTTDAPNGIESKLLIDHIYVDVTREGYVHEYEWSDLPEGDQAALAISVSGRNDDLGVEVHEARLNVVSSKG